LFLNLAFAPNPTDLSQMRYNLERSVGFGAKAKFRNNID